MLNVTILHLFMSYSMKSPLLTPSGFMCVSKSSFSYFSEHILLSYHSAKIKQSFFSNFLSNAIKISNFDRYYDHQSISTRLEAKDDRLQILLCIFRNCVASGGGGGGAIFITGGSLEVNYTGFQNCHVDFVRSYGGAVYTDSNLVVFNGVCSDSCYTTDYGQSFYLLNKDSHIEFTTITRCGATSTSSSAETISVTGTVNIQNLNSTGNVVSGNAAGIWCTKTNSESVFRVIHSSFVSNSGRSIFDITCDVGDTISFSNFVSNAASKSIVFSYGFHTRPTFSQCVFQLNTCSLLIEVNSLDNIVSLVNCYSNTPNWGNATLSNCAVVVTATINNVFANNEICNGNYQIPPRTVITPEPTQQASSEFEDFNDSIPPTSVITSLFPLPSATQQNCNIICPDCNDKKKDAGKIVAIVFCILEALLILILVGFLILLIIYHKNKDKNQNQGDAQKGNTDGDQFAVIEEEEEENEVNLKDINTPDKEDNNESFMPTPHMPSADQSPSGAKRAHHERQLTPQIPRKKRKRQVPVNERSPLIEPRKKVRIVFSSSDDSETV
ncbi:hypothetical protein M9Y10_002029 [Tritrichomonas musculus]|uniref:Polymorphic outer membrane protein n=1 Tax=Tritrichomonas musculus TaxID=1915356 RepID=A0ABR2L8M2_9EUKA